MFRLTVLIGYKVLKSSVSKRKKSASSNLPDSQDAVVSHQRVCRVFRTRRTHNIRQQAVRDKHVLKLTHVAQTLQRWIARCHVNTL